MAHCRGRGTSRYMDIKLLNLSCLLLYTSPSIYFRNTRIFYIYKTLHCSSHFFFIIGVSVWLLGAGVPVERETYPRVSAI